MPERASIIEKTGCPQLLKPGLGLRYTKQSWNFEVIGLGNVQTGSSGIAMIFFLHSMMALVMDPSGVRSLDFPQEMSPFPLPMKSRVRQQLILLSVVTLVEMFLSRRIMTKSSSTLNHPLGQQFNSLAFGLMLHLTSISLSGAVRFSSTSF